MRMDFRYRKFSNLLFSSFFPLIVAIGLKEMENHNNVQAYRKANAPLFYK